MAHLATIAVFPIKGFPALELESAAIEQGRILPADRRFAFIRPELQEKALDKIAKGSSWLSKAHLLQILNTAALSGIDVSFRLSETDQPLLSWQGKDFCLDDRRDLSAFQSQFSNWYGKPLQLRDAGTVQAFADQDTALISLLNLASIEDMANKSGVPMSWQRLRGNLMLQGLPAWQEASWIGKTLKIGAATFKVQEPIERCDAPGVNLQGQKDHDLLKFMSQTYRHRDCGVFLEAAGTGTIKVNDKAGLVTAT